MSLQRLQQEADDVQDLYSATGADAARAAAASATDKADKAGLAKCTQPQTLQETRGVLCHRVGCWRHENGGHLEMFSATGAGAGQSAGDGATGSATTDAMYSTTGAGAAVAAGLV